MSSLRRLEDTPLVARPLVPMRTPSFELYQGGWWAVAPCQGAPVRGFFSRANARFGQSGAGRGHARLGRSFPGFCAIVAPDLAGGICVPSLHRIVHDSLHFDHRTRPWDP